MQFFFFFQFKIFYPYFSKEQLLKAFKKKKECDNKALSAVEKLLEPIDSDKEFLEQVIATINYLKDQTNTIKNCSIVEGNKSISLR